MLFIKEKQNIITKEAILTYTKRENNILNLIKKVFARNLCPVNIEISNQKKLFLQNICNL